ncbi:Histidine kinase-, DNA gyrase B-, and HSP90-like ATPase [Pedococcus dokdonensis]|uniref:histidine kinase n=1 Tax=Pedococcus dokdonensis TaxID=443156 RepID=A0A1H0TQC0_9MICO|nr:ATP-binding protein [Pedococcus dokdonensis]SDP56143.1 Histidine kinase-, DNA gyrase B-, and HSP90-like ATPase [Pedococcus dokdonensis]
MSAEELGRIALFDGLTAEQRDRLWSAGTEWSFGPGDVPFHEGHPADFWWVLLEGTLSLNRRVGAQETELGMMVNPGQWAGGFQAWDAHGVYLATARGVQPGRMLKVPAEALGDVAREWFPFGVHLIGGLVNTVRSIEAKARQRESLVALGTLAAGLAHEINNPASAATRAVDALDRASEALGSSLRRLGESGATAEQFVELDTLRRSLVARAAEPDAVAAADLEEELSDWLADHDVERDWVLAPPLAAAGADPAFLERAAGVLGTDQLAPGLEWMASSLAVDGLLGEIREATHRVSELVGSVRSYSQMDRSLVQRTDVTEGLESTLVMLGHKLRGGITVVRDYAPDLPMVEAIPGELNQVWTNLIDNAVDAMKGAGTLWITVRGSEERTGAATGEATGAATRGGVDVEIADDGPGVPDEVIAHAFEPFFTTKEVGKGTGLGLDISRRIVVERHGGEISLSPRSGGGAAVRVHVPLRPAEG